MVALFSSKMSIKAAAIAATALLYFLPLSCSGNVRSQDHRDSTKGPHDDTSTPNQRATADDGAITSGGGELVADAHNPWFLHNTPVVKYCITASSEFGWDDERYSKIDTAFQSAVSYWNEQIKLAEPYQKFRASGSSRVLLGGQRFERTHCADQSIDLHLNLGVLTGEQLALVRDPSRFAALTVRTSYDQENLRGKGFIYIAPDRGVRAFRGDNIVEAAWTLGERNDLLKRTFMHELGHVLGLQHNESPGQWLMSAKFVETMLKKEFYEKYLTEDEPDWLLQNYKDPQSMMNSGFINCFRKDFSPTPILKFLSVNLEKGRCLRFDPFKDDRKPNTAYGFQIWQSSETGERVMHLGFVGAERFDDKQMRVSNTIVSELYVTDQQRVLPIAVKEPRSVPVLESSIFKFNGSFIEFYGDKKQTLSLVSIEPNRIKITAAVGDEIYEDVFGFPSFQSKLKH
jgi:hypothetical protein